MRGTITLWALTAGLLLGACNRIPLTPPVAGTPQFTFEINWQGSSYNGDEGTGAWVFSTDTASDGLNHSTLYTDLTTGDQWELVYHEPLAATTTGWQVGVLDHRPSASTASTGMLTADVPWVNLAEWSVNGVYVEPSADGVIEWEADSVGHVEIECDWELEIGDEELDQRIDIDLYGLNTCESSVLPGPFAVQTGSDADNTWAFYPPVDDAGVVWRWIVDGDDEEVTEGGNPLFVEFNEDWADDFEIRLVAEEEDAHPYGTFEVRYRLEWSGDDEDDEWWGDVWSGGGIGIVSGGGDSTPWMELRYQPAGAAWQTSELLCSEADQANWKFEINEVLVPEQGSLYPTEERISFACTLPLRLEGQWEEPVATAQLSGVWPVAALD